MDPWIGHENPSLLFRVGDATIFGGSFSRDWLMSGSTSMMEVSPLPCFAVRKIQEQVARCKTIPVNVVSVPEFSIMFREREGVSSQFFLLYILIQEKLL